MRHNFGISEKADIGELAPSDHHDRLIDQIFFSFVPAQYNPDPRLFEQSLNQTDEEPGCCADADETE